MESCTETGNGSSNGSPRDTPCFEAGLALVAPSRPPPTPEQPGTGRSRVHAGRFQETCGGIGGHSGESTSLPASFFVNKAPAGDEQQRVSGFRDLSDNWECVLWRKGRRNSER